MEQPSEPPGDATSTRSEIWMPYGDIILQVQGTQFRVNRDVLAKHSAVFHDLFSVPQPPNEVTVEGCHIVQLSDSAEDWVLLLEFLYDPFDPKTTPEFDLLAAMLRLGKKYEISRAEEDSVSRIQYEFPSDFQAFNDLDADMTKIKYHRGIYCDLLRLAYECGVYSSIPLLAFCCLRTDKLETIFKGVRRSDGSSATLPDDLKLTMALALERIALFQHESLSWLRTASVIPHTACQSKARCTEQQHSMARVVEQDHKGQFNLGYTIDQWDDRWTGMLCPVCDAAAEGVYELNRAKGWELLPGFFGLPQWEELRNLV
ncbi:hypothetical protein DFH07DRAFT_928463 [Mycena maculata]|uniref:BTB domain-containing protein n=1 Tax=Mycena maculata TaxID=230809 RepID=A0AAD7I5D8_9AGAR|nr:hypothetical protein DFH07DRAFT_928463 [Mycena maculata]